MLGVDANPEAFEHARLRYVRQNLRFERGLVETYGEPGSVRRGRVPADDRARAGPGGGAAALPPLLAPGGAAYVSTPNLLTLAPPGAEKSENPWHLKEYRAGRVRALCPSVFGSVELLGLFHARKLRGHELALRLGWDRVHDALGIYEAVLRPLHPGDRRQRLPLPRRPRPRAGLPGRLPACGAPRASRAGQLTEA